MPGYTATHSPMPKTSSPAAELQHKIEKRTAVVGIVGLGYVGLPLLRAFFKSGFPVIGFDIDEAKIRQLRAGQSYLKHLGEDYVREMAASPKFEATADG